MQGICPDGQVEVKIAIRLQVVVRTKKACRYKLMVEVVNVKPYVKSEKPLQINALNIYLRPAVIGDNLVIVQICPCPKVVAILNEVHLPTVVNQHRCETGSGIGVFDNNTGLP